jgi:hypothetical protein
MDFMQIHLPAEMLYRNGLYIAADRMQVYIVQYAYLLLLVHYIVFLPCLIMFYLNITISVRNICL